MEGKNMRVLVQTIVLLLMVALVAGQPGSNSPPVPQTPPANGLVPPAIPGSDQLPPGSGMLPPGAGMLPPGAGMLPPGGGMFPRWCWSASSYNARGWCGSPSNPW